MMFLFNKYRCALYFTRLFVQHYHALKNPSLFCIMKGDKDYGTTNNGEKEREKTYFMNVQNKETGNSLWTQKYILWVDC